MTTAPEDIDDTNQMHVEYTDPRTLEPNPWNPNVVDPINQMKLEESIRRDGIKRPIVVRELDDGRLQIIGGQHRTAVAVDLGLDLVPVINRGRISDRDAKRETLLDNFRYGTDDTQRFSDLLMDPDIGSAEELLATMPIDEEELAGYFEHLGNDDLDAHIDELLGDGGSVMADDDPEGVDLGVKPTRTHQIMRFRVSIEDAARIDELIKQTRATQGFVAADDMTNAGDALAFLLLSDE